MKLTIIVKKEDYEKLKGECDFLSNDIFICSRRSVRDMNDFGNVNDDEVALQITVDKVYSIQKRSKLVEVEG